VTSSTLPALIISLNNDSHDDIADILNVSSKSFEATYDDKVEDMKRTFLDYIKTLEKGVSGAGAGAGASPNSLQVQLNPEGFPIIPSPASWDKITKDDLERLYRHYITIHYRK
jgi:hypothetical protein